MHLKLLAQLLAASLVTSGQLLTLVIFFVLSLPPKICKGLQILDLKLFIFTEG